MKKSKMILGVSVLLVASLLITGCGKEIPVKNGAKVAVSTEGNKYTATEYYEKIKKDNIAILVNMIDHGILDDKYELDDEEKQGVENQINQIKEYYGEDEDTYKSVIKQYFGADNDDEVRTQLILESKRNKAVNVYIDNQIGEDEVKKYYEENIFGEIKASHILITVDAKDDATEEEKQEAEKKALEKAQKVIKELNNGKKFKNLAKKYSKDEATASNGGDLGYFQLNDMVSEFSEAVKQLKKNEYTKEPVKTEYGYHIILKTGERDKPSLEDKEVDIKAQIRVQRLNDDSTLYYKTLMAIREENKIKWNDDTLKNAYDDYMQRLIKSQEKTVN